MTGWMVAASTVGTFVFGTLIVFIRTLRQAMKQAGELMSVGTEILGDKEVTKAMHKAYRGRYDRPA
jgi:uncharacterized SAM-dependent methyltransferase